MRGYYPLLIPTQTIFLGKWDLPVRGSFVLPPRAKEKGCTDTYVFECMYLDTQIRLFYVYVCIQICHAYIRMCTYTYVCIYMFTYIYTYINIYIFMRLDALIDTWLCVRRRSWRGLVVLLGAKGEAIQALSRSWCLV